MSEITLEKEVKKQDPEGNEQNLQKSLKRKNSLELEEKKTKIVIKEEKEAKKQSTKVNEQPVQNSLKRKNSIEDKEKKTKIVIKEEKEQTKEEFLNEKLANMKNYIEIQECFKNSLFLKKILELKVDSLIEWVIWINSQKISVDEGFDIILKDQKFSESSIPILVKEKILLYFKFFNEIILKK